MRKAIRQLDFKEMIRRKAHDLGMSLEQVREKTGMSESTFYRRVKHPSDLTLREVYILDLYLHFDDKEKLELANLKYR